MMTMPKYIVAGVVLTGLAVGFLAGSVRLGQMQREQQAAAKSSHHMASLAEIAEVLQKAQPNVER